MYSVHLSFTEAFRLHFVKLNKMGFRINHGKEGFNSSNAKMINAISVCLINAFQRTCLIINDL